VRIVVCVKRVPDTAADKRLDPADLTLDRVGVDSLMNAVDEFAVEAALQLKEARGGEDEVTLLTMGPAAAEKDAVRKALALGPDGAVMVTDARLAGADALVTAYVLAAAARRGGFDLVLLGSESTDARTSLVPMAVAQILEVPGLTNSRSVEVTGDAVTVQREREGGYDVVTAPLPAVVSIVKGSNEPRYATLKGIMAAKSKPLEVLTVDDLGLDAAALTPRTQVLEVAPRPPRDAGSVLVDENGSSVGPLADFLQEYL
jgi:electron transfer flavoprotein beta subunit